MMGSLATNAHATATVAADETNSVKLNYSPQGGLGLFSDSYVVDTRFSELGREGRLIRLLQDTRHLPVIGATRGIGIDEDTALVVTNSLTKPVAKVIYDSLTRGLTRHERYPIKESWCSFCLWFERWSDFLVASFTLTWTVCSPPPILMALSASTIYPSVSSAWTTQWTSPQVRSFIFPSGKWISTALQMRITVIDWWFDSTQKFIDEVRYADWKSALAGVEWFKKAKPSTDIFSDETGGRWRYAAKRLVDCRDDFVITNYSIETFKPQFQVVFDRGQCVAYGSDISNTTTFVASYRNLLVSIKALPIAD